MGSVQDKETGVHVVYHGSDAKVGIHKHSEATHYDVVSGFLKILSAETEIAIYSPGSWVSATKH